MKILPETILPENNSVLSFALDLYIIPYIHMLVNTVFQ